MCQRRSYSSILLLLDKNPCAKYDRSKVFAVRVRTTWEENNMEPTKKPRVKICCVRDVQEASTAKKYGVFALGRVSEMPSGPSVIHDDLITELAPVIPLSVSSV